MSFKKKLLVAFLIMAVPLAVIGALALWSLRAQRAGVRHLQQALDRARLFSDVESATYRKIRKVRDYLGGHDVLAKEEFRRLDQASRVLLAQWSAATVASDERPFVRNFEALDREISALAQRVFELAEQGQKDAAQRLLEDELNGRLLPSLDSVITTVYVNARTRSIRLSLRSLETTARSTSVALGVIVVAALVFSGIFSFAIARNLARPLEQLKAGMDLAGEGAFERARDLDVSARDEIGDLARAFVRMAERLQGVQEDLRHKIDSLREAQSQLIQSEKLASLGQLAAAVAHGLRNPLASIRAATQLNLLRLSGDSPLREQLQAVIEEVDRLEKRIAHLLDFARPASFAPAATSLRRLVEGAAAVFSERLAGQGIELRFSFEAALPDAWLDAAQVEQALIELLANAIDAMPRGGSLAVGIARADGAEGGRPMLRVDVEDSGGGIPEAALSRVGEPFFTTRADGTGLGLAIAKRFVVQNKGLFEIASVFGRGTRVTLTLPAATRAPA